MKAGNVLAKIGEIATRHLARFEQRAEFLAGIKLAHPHREIERCARSAIYNGRVLRAGNRSDAEVEISRVAAVQSQLFFAEHPAPGDGRVVQEAELQGFLDLVGKLAGEQDPRDVSFGDTQGRANRVRVRTRRQQSPYEWRVMISAGHPLSPNRAYAISSA